MFQGVLGVDGHRFSCMGSVWRRNLKAFTTDRTHNQHCSSVMELMESLEEMDSPKRNPLLGSAGLAGVDDFLEPSDHRSPRIRLPARLVGFCRDARSLEVFRDSLVVSEDLSGEAHRTLADRTEQRIFAKDRDLTLSPGELGRQSRWRRFGRRDLTQGCPSLSRFRAFQRLAKSPA